MDVQSIVNKMKESVESTAADVDQSVKIKFGEYESSKTLGAYMDDRLLTSSISLSPKTFAQAVGALEPAELEMLLSAMKGAIDATDNMCISCGYANDVDSLVCYAKPDSQIGIEGRPRCCIYYQRGLILQTLIDRAMQVANLMTSINAQPGMPTIKDPRTAS